MGVGKTMFRAMLSSSGGDGPFTPPTGGLMIDFNPKKENCFKDEGNPYTGNTNVTNEGELVYVVTNDCNYTLNGTKQWFQASGETGTKFCSSSSQDCGETKRYRRVYAATYQEDSDDTPYLKFVDEDPDCDEIPCPDEGECTSYSDDCYIPRENGGYGSNPNSAAFRYKSTTSSSDVVYEMSIYAVVESNTTQNASTSFSTNDGFIIGQAEDTFCDAGWTIAVNDGDAKSYVGESPSNCGNCTDDEGYIEESAYDNTGRQIVCLRWKSTETASDRINSLTVANSSTQDTSTGNTDFGQWEWSNGSGGDMWLTDENSPSVVQRLVIGCAPNGSGAIGLDDSFYTSGGFFQGKMFRILAYSTCHSETVRDKIIDGLKETYNIS